MSSHEGMPTRRAAMIAGVAALGRLSHPEASRLQNSRVTGMGLVVYVRSIRRRWMRSQNPDTNLFEPLTFLKHVVECGAGGAQLSLGILDNARVVQVREFAERNDLFIEAIIRPPTDANDLDRFEREVRTACETGAIAARTTIIPGRRYERFRSLEEFRDFQRRGHAMLERAVPIVEKHRVPLAVENHKDERIAERVALLRRINSEYVGACVDTGNSFALLDDPYETVRALAPFAKSVHLKDQGLQAIDSGFLLADVALGAGSFDLKRMVADLRAVQPNIRFVLELITRDALVVPCLTEDYWSTFPDIPASDLARTLRFVRQHPAARIPQVSQLSEEQQVRLEDEHVRQSLQFAASELKL